MHAPQEGVLPAGTDADESILPLQIVNECQNQRKRADRQRNRQIFHAGKEHQNNTRHLHVTRKFE